MFRSTSLIALTAVISLSLAAPQANAGGHKHGGGNNYQDIHRFISKHVNTGGNHRGGGGFKPPTITLPPVKICPPRPPVIRPICPPVVRPPVLKPIFPPIVRPICPPPVVRPICPPPIVRPICPPPIVRPICPPPVVCPPKPPVCPPPVIKPICYKPPVVLPPPVVCPPTCTCHKCTCDDWYFGMSVQVVQTTFGIGLQVYDVTHGSPACQAGLEVGDILVMAAGQTFETVQTNEEGVALLQSLATATQANLNLVVQDSRTSQIASVNLTPVSQSEPAPAVTTAMAF